MTAPGGGNASSYKIGINRNCGIVGVSLSVILTNQFVRTTDCPSVPHIYIETLRHRPDVQHRNISLLPFDLANNVTRAVRKFRKFNTGMESDLHRSAGGIAFIYAMFKCQNVYLHGYDKSRKYADPSKQMHGMHDMAAEHSWIKCASYPMCDRCRPLNTSVWCTLPSCDVTDDIHDYKFYKREKCHFANASSEDMRRWEAKNLRLLQLKYS